MAHPMLLAITNRPGVIGVVPTSRAHINLRAGTYERLKYSTFLLLVRLALGVISANMGYKLLVALQLEDAHHFIERCASGPTSGCEPPPTFGTTKTPETLLVNPHQLPAHDLLCRCVATVSDRMPGGLLPSADKTFRFAITSAISP